MNRRKNVFRFGCGLWGLLLALLLTVSPLQSLAEEESARQEFLETAEVSLYQCGALPQEGPRPALYSLSDLESYLLEQLQNQASEIDVREYGVDAATFSPIYQNLLNAHPELFYVEGYYRYSYYSSGILVKIIPSYKYTGDTLRARQSQFNAELNRIVSYASGASSTLGKLLLVNDYFCINYQYDNSLSRHAADDLFIDKTGVCQAYMLGFRAVMNQLGIPCGTATSEAMNHTWNTVRVDGSWYHMDVTWNDPVPDGPLCVGHNNFLLSDAGIQGTGHYDWSTDVVAGNTRFDNFFWREANTPLPMQGNSVYYGQMDYDAWKLSILRWTIGGDTTEVHVADVGSHSIYGGFHPVQIVEGQLCYAIGDQIYLLNAATNTANLAYTLPNGGYIFSSLYSGGQMRICAGADYNSRELMTIQLSLPAPDPVVLLAPSSVPAYSKASMTVQKEGAEAYRIYRLPDELVAEGTRPEFSVTCNAPGTYVATAQVYGVWQEMSEPVTVMLTVDTVLPDDLLQIEAEAFLNAGFTAVECPQGLTRIGARAFANCKMLAQIHIPDSVTEIADDAFQGSENVTLCGTEGSYAHQWAQTHGIPWFTNP